MKPANVATMAIGPALVEAGSADLVMNVSRFESPRRL
jgi:hypothetical protein